MVNLDATPDADESRWIRAAQKGDRQAFEALVELHGRQVLRYLRGLCGSHSDAEDLIQETFIQAYRSLGSFRAEARFRPWLLTIAYRCWVHEKRRRRPVAVEDPDALRDVSAPEAAVAEGGLEEAVQQGLQTLPEDQRVVFLLRFGDGLSHAEIAAITGAAPATVRWRLFQGRQALQTRLKKWSPKKDERKP